MCECKVVRNKSLVLREDGAEEGNIEIGGTGFLRKPERANLCERLLCRKHRSQILSPLSCFSIIPCSKTPFSDPMLPVCVPLGLVMQGLQNRRFRRFGCGVCFRIQPASSTLRRQPRMRKPRRKQPLLCSLGLGPYDSTCKSHSNTDRRRIKSVTPSF